MTSHPNFYRCNSKLVYYIIINDALEDAVDEIHCILSAEKSKTIRMSKIIDEVF